MAFQEGVDDLKQPVVVLLSIHTCFTYVRNSLG